MKTDLEPAKDVLRSFYSEVAAVEKIRQNISGPIHAPFNINDRTPDFSQIEFTPEPDSYYKQQLIIWNQSYLECLIKGEVTFDQSEWEGNDINSDIIEDFCLIAKSLPLCQKRREKCFSALMI